MYCVMYLTACFLLILVPIVVAINKMDKPNADIVGN